MDVKGKSEMSELEAEIVHASAIMTMYELLNNESEDYIHGFFDGLMLQSEMIREFDRIRLAGRRLRNEPNKV